MWHALDQGLGFRKANRLFWWSALEAVASQPKTLFFVWHGFWEFFLGGDVEYNLGYRQEWDGSWLSQWRLHTYKPDVPEFRKELDRQSSSPALEHIWNCIFYYQSFLKIGAVLTGLLFTAFLFRMDRVSQGLSASLALLLIYHALTAVAFASPHYRYISPVIPAVILYAGLCINACRRDRQQAA